MDERYLWTGAGPGEGDGWGLMERGEFFLLSQHPPLCLIRTLVNESPDFAIAQNLNVDILGL